MDTVYVGESTSHHTGTNRFPTDQTSSAQGLEHVEFRAFSLKLHAHLGAGGISWRLVPKSFVPLVHFAGARVYPLVN